MNTGIDPAFPPMIMFYSIGFFRLFDQIGIEESSKLAQAASDISGERALQYECNTGVTHELPHVGKVTPGKVLAAMPAFLVWRMKRQSIDYFPESVLLRASLDAWILYELENKQHHL